MLDANAVLLTAFGVTNPGNFVLLDLLLRHPLVFLPLASGLLLASTATARALPRWAKLVLAATQVLFVLVAFPLLWLTLAMSGSSTLTEPDSGAYEVVREMGSMTDATTEISIRQKTGLFARSWEVGCLSADDQANAVEEVRWDGPERLIIQTYEHGQVIVDVSPTTGHPVRIQDPGILGC